MLFPALAEPDTKFTNGKPVFRIKIVTTPEEARIFYKACCQVWLNQFFAASVSSNLLMPVRRNERKQIVVRADSFIRPTVIGAAPSAVARGDEVRVSGALYAFQRETGSGVNFRFSCVEMIAS